MTVSLTYKPTDPRTGKSFASGSTLHSILEATFGAFPLTLTVADIGKLEGMAACGHSDLHELVNAISMYKSVEVNAYW